jgi:hypothetical protein
MPSPSRCLEGRVVFDLGDDLAILVLSTRCLMQQGVRADQHLSHRQACCLRRIARATGRPHQWCASMPWSSDSRPCCTRSISCNLLCKTSMAHSVMSRKSALIGSHRRRDNSPVAGRVTHPTCVTPLCGDDRLLSSGYGPLSRACCCYRNTVTSSSLVGRGDHDEWSPSLYSGAAFT